MKWGQRGQRGLPAAFSSSCPRRGHQRQDSPSSPAAAGPFAGWAGEASIGPGSCPAAGEVPAQEGSARGTPPVNGRRPGRKPLLPADRRGRGGRAAPSSPRLHLGAANRISRIACRPHHAPPHQPARSFRAAAPQFLGTRFSCPHKRLMIGSLDEMSRFAAGRGRPAVVRGMRRTSGPACPAVRQAEKKF